MSLKHFLFIFNALLLTTVACFAKQTDTSKATVSELRCEYRQDPLGIDTLSPRLSWKLFDKTFTRGQGQTAYQILLANDPSQLQEGTGDVWNSGKVVSPESFNVEYSGPALTSGHEYFWKVKVWDKDGRETAWSPVGRFAIGLLQPADWTGDWIALDTAADQDQTWLRKSFSLEKPAKRALLALASAGYQEVYVNGKRLNDEVLVPNHYFLTKRIPYRMYDISHQLRKGENVVAIWLAPGFSIFSMMDGPYTNQLPKRPLCKFQLNGVMDNGHAFTVVSDATTKCHLSSGKNVGAYHNSHFGGECIDHRAELPGWNNTGFDESGWVAATTYTMQREMTPDMSPPDRIQETIAPQSITQIGPNKFKVDFGRMFAGWYQIHLPKQPAGTFITFEASSIPEVDCELNQHDNLICNGDPKGETFCNHFNYHLIRYLVIEGISHAPNLDDIKGLLISNDTPLIAKFECSNDLINQIYQNTLNNNRILTLGGITVDCQHRERCGYGDVATTDLPRLSTYDSGAFYTKIEGDWVDMIHPDGSGQGTAPTTSGDRGGAIWTAILIILPWEMYMNYHDTRVMQKSYPAMKSFLGFLAQQKGPDGLMNLIESLGGLGDWAGITHSQDKFYANCYYAYLNDLMSKMAAILGHQDDATAYANESSSVKSILNRTYFNSSTHNYVDGSQANLVMPLAVDVVPPAEVPAVVHQLEQRIIVARNGHLETGNTGTYWMTRYLSEHDRSDLIFTYATQTTYPGYGYLLERGFKTWPEYWNGHPGSLAHACYDGIWAWFQEGLSGIRYDSANPGFRHFILDPPIAGNVTWVKSSLDFNYGPIVSNWSLEGKTYHYDIEVPPGTTATVSVPAKEGTNVTESDQPAEKAIGVKFLRAENNKAVYAVSSGSYRFQSTIP
jgi:alpha-L-rhamnosidase